MHTLNLNSYPTIMATTPRSGATKSVRQSVTLPVALYTEVRRFARQQNVSQSRALIDLAARGLRAETEARDRLESAYEAFLASNETADKVNAGRELIRAVFGNAALAPNISRCNSN